MAVKKESGCVDCGLPCRGKYCAYYEDVTFICDECGEEVDTLYWFEGRQLCSNCVLNELQEVTKDD